MESHYEQLSFYENVSPIVRDECRKFSICQINLDAFTLQIMGYQFEPGTLLSPCIYLTHHREDLYPEPKQFKPERFLLRQFASYEYLPFGGGNRRCLGMAFAQFEMKLVLATVLSRWQMELADSKPVRPVRNGLLMVPAEGVRMVVTGKRPQNQRILQTRST